MTRRSLAQIFAIGGCVAVCMHTPKALARGKMEVFWVNHAGKISRAAKVTDMKWVWETRDPKSEIPTPSLRIWIDPETKKSQKITAMKQTGLTVVEGFHVSTEKIVVDLFSSEANLCGQFHDTMKFEEKCIVVLTKVDSPFLLKHANCENIDNHVYAKGNASKNLFMGLYCSKQNDQTAFTLLKSSDATWSRSAGADRTIASDGAVRKTALKETFLKRTEAQEVLSAAVTDRSENVSEYKVFHREVSLKTTAPPTASISQGFSFLDYSETDFQPYQQTASTLKLGYYRPLGWENWDVAAGGFMTTLIHSANIKGIQARYLGLNARLGYNFPFVKKPWTLTVLGGWYFTTMFVRGSSFGYKNLQGPQLFPVVRRSLTPKLGASAYVKYAPITMGVSVLDPGANREIACGLSATYKLAPNHSISAAADYADLQFSALEKTSHSTSLSFSVGYSYIFSKNEVTN